MPARRYSSPRLPGSSSEMSSAARNSASHASRQRQPRHSRILRGASGHSPSFHVWPSTFGAGGGAVSLDDVPPASCPAISARSTAWMAARARRKAVLYAATRGPSSTTTTRVGSAPMPPTNPQDAPNRCSSAAAWPRRTASAALWRSFSDSSTTMPWRSDRPSTPGRPRRATGRMRAASVRRRRCSSNLWAAMSTGRYPSPMRTSRSGRLSSAMPENARSPGGRSWRSTPPTIRSAPAAMASNVARSASAPSSTTTGSGRAAITDARWCAPSSARRRAVSESAGRTPPAERSRTSRYRHPTKSGPVTGCGTVSSVFTMQPGYRPAATGVNLVASRMIRGPAAAEIRSTPIHRTQTSTAD